MRPIRPVILFEALFCCLVSLGHTASSGTGDGGEADNAYGCSLPSTPTTKGFTAKFYAYAFGDISNVNAKFMAGGYKTATPTATATAVTDPTIDYEVIDNLQDTAEVYGQTVPVTNFLVELTGYFYPPTSGFYTNKLINVDDDAMLFIGSSSAFECCDSTTSSSDAADNYNLYTANALSSKIFLEKNFYYPIRIVFANRINVATLTYQIIDPDGKNVSLADTIYLPDLDNTGSCPATTVYEYTTTTTEGWTGSSTVTVTPSGQSGSILSVEIEKPYSTTTTTSTWSNSYTSTTTTTLPGGSKKIIVENPPDKTPTSIVPTSFDSTFTSSGPSGPVVIIDSKTSYSTPTSTIPGSIHTTFTSSGPSGPVIVVENPVSTIFETIPWAKTFSSVTTFTSSGTPYVDYLIPGTPSTVETTDQWTGTTEKVTTFTSNGIPYVEHLTPYDTISTYWSGSSTITTLVSNPTGSGSIYEVLIPSPSPSTTTITIIKPCTGQQSSTYTTTSGCTVAVVVENPKVTAITTITDCQCTDDENQTLLGKPTSAIASEPVQVSGGGAITSAPVEVSEGGSTSLSQWPLTIISSILLMIFFL